MNSLRRYSLRVCLLGGICASMGVLQGADDLAGRYDAEVKPLLDKYCFRCHNGEKKEGELDLAQYDAGAKAVKASNWTTVIERFSLREMPPKGEPEPSDPERKLLFTWMQGLFATSNGDCTQLATDVTQHFYRGNVMSRRLTRAEYNNTVRDLFGIDLKPADEFPADGGGGEGFDTTGDALFTNPILLEKYLAAADKIVEAALPDGADDSLPPHLLLVRQQIVGNIAPEAAVQREAASQSLKKFLRRAYRRPVTEEDLGRLLSLFDKALARGDSHLASMRLALKGALVNPNFLFLVEPEPEKGGIYPLGSLPLASRLSYFLWASMPDEELLALAEADKLVDAEVLRGQVRRMLADPKSRGLAETFAIQWLGIGTLGAATRPDGGKFPEFDDQLATAMKTEAVELVAGIFREDRSLLEFLDADYVMVNDRLAQHYAISDVAGPEFRRVSLADKNRGGLLGLGAMHATTSYPLRSSPVLRGKWVLAEVLGSKVPPPPANVPSLPADDKPQDGLTLRQRLEQHRQNADCASCHNRMDPLGFGLENFDAIGRWRTEIGGQPVDASGELPSGEKFTSPAELKQVLLNRKDEFLKNLSRKLLGYALGRDLNRFDDCVIRDALKALHENNFRSTILFEQIVLSYPFTHRYVKK